MCSRDISYQNPTGTMPITNLSIYKRINNVFTTCKYRQVYPSFTPTINNLSTTNSITGNYMMVYINGTNFLPPSYGTTYVNFGTFQQLPITFYSAFNISFVVPLNATAGTYNVQVVNIYNGNFSPSVNQSYPGIQNYSNSIIYTIT
jgi:uncharacterized protein (TIGR03437 family)